MIYILLWANFRLDCPSTTEVGNFLILWGEVLNNGERQRLQRSGILTSELGVMSSVHLDVHTVALSKNDENLSKQHAIVQQIIVL